MTGPLTVAEAARRLGICDQTVRTWFDAGLLAGHRTAAGHRRIELDNEPHEEHVTVAAAARLLGLSSATVRSRFDQGRLAGYRTAAGHRRIARSAVTRPTGATRP